MSYAEMYGLLPEAPASLANITSSFIGDLLDDGAIAAILAHLQPSRVPSAPALAAVELRVLGGAIARVPSDATAFAHRQRRLLTSVVAAGFDPAEVDRHRAWVESLYRAMAHLAQGAYVNFLGAGGEARRSEAYPDASYRRLAEVKYRYDPTNAFRRTLNIWPAERQS
jgi:hypothetical protein